MTTRAIETIQRRLDELGYEPGPIDNEEGPKTSAAVVRFKQRHGYKATDYLGPLTLTKLFSDDAKKAEPKPAVSNELPWIARARKLIGTNEVPGKGNNPEIVRWWQVIGATWFKDDATPHCGAFVGAVLKESGYPILSAALAPRALEWAKYGKAVPENTYGAIVTFKRSGGGHVGFAVGRDEQGRLMVLGSNQSNKTSIVPFDRAVVAWRYPPGVALDTRPMPRLKSNGQPASQNEA